jgi:galactokinase
MNLTRLNDDFIARFAGPDKPPSTFFAPGRVNLIGEHTDYNGGFVLPCALQYGTYLVARTNDDKLIRFASFNMPFTAEVPLAELSARIGKEWVNYPLGIFDQFSQSGIPLQGFDLYYSGDIPGSAGLSSSASIEMVTAFALRALLPAPHLEMIDLVKLAQRAENHFVGVNCGIMDQFAVGMGKQDHALFLNCHTLEYKMVPLVLNGFRLIIANTNKPRDLAGSKYNERVAECQLAITYLSREMEVSRLSEVGFMNFYKLQDRIPDEVIRKRARHVISENQRVLNAVSCLQKGDLPQFGALMNASHESLRDNYEVTGFELDALVDEARKVNGVVGARMTGAGFGGCTINLVREEAVSGFTDRVGRGYHALTGLQADFYEARVSSGVHEVTEQI